MVDIADLCWPIPLFQDEGRHGLEMLARYKVGRSFSFSSPSEKSLQYIDKLVDALLEVGENGGDLRDVISYPALGLASRKGRRPDRSGLRAAHGHFKPTGPSLPALRWKELIEAGDTPKKAMRTVEQEYPGSEPSAVRKAAKRYAKAIKHTLKSRALDRSWNQRICDEAEHDLVVYELLAACRNVTAFTPRTRLLLTPELIHTQTGKRGWPKIEVTFPPNKKRLANRLAKLDADDVMELWELARICIAEEAQCTLKEARKAFGGWYPEARYDFAKAALAHLQTTNPGQ